MSFIVPERNTSKKNSNFIVPERNSVSTVKNIDKPVASNNIPQNGNVVKKTLPQFLMGGAYNSVVGEPNKLATSTVKYGLKNETKLSGQEGHHIIGAATGGISIPENFINLNQSDHDRITKVQDQALKDFKSGKISLPQARLIAQSKLQEIDLEKQGVYQGVLANFPKALKESIPKVLGDLAKGLVLPFIQTGVTIINQAKNVGQIAKGLSGKKNLTNYAEQSINVPGFGNVEPLITGNEKPKELAKKVVGNSLEIAPYFLAMPEAKGLLATIDTIGIKPISQITRQEGLQFAKAYGTKIASTALGLGTMFGLGGSIKEGADAKQTAENVSKSIATIALLEMTLSPLIKYGISKAGGKTTVKESVDKVLDENKDLIVEKVKEIKANPELKLPELPKIEKTKFVTPEDVNKLTTESIVEPQKPASEVLAPKTNKLSTAKEITKTDPKNFKTAEDYVKAQTDPFYEYNNKGLKVFSDEFKGKSEFKTAIDDIGGIKNVERGTVPINNLNPTEIFNANNEGVVRAIKEIKSGVKVPLVVQSGDEGMFVGNFDVIDGNHRLAAYKALGIKEIPIITTKGDLPNIKTPSQLISEWNKAHNTAPIVQIKPVKTESDILKSSVYKRLQNEIPEKYREDINYSKQNLLSNTEKAVELVATDKNKAYQIGMGLKSAPEGQTATAVNIALSTKALKDKNYSLYAKLIKNRSLAQTRRGQEIVAEKGSITDNSTARYVKELISVKLDELGNRYSFGINTKKLSLKEKAIKVVDKEVEKYDKVIKDKKLDIKEAQSILDKLTCK